MSSDLLRLRVASIPGRFDGFEVQIFVNDLEITAAAGRLGMDPWQLLNRAGELLAEEPPRRVTISRCTCGYPGCARTDVTIQRHPAIGLVTWNWHENAPLERPAVFDAQQYDAELARAHADLSWESSARTATRLFYAGVDDEVLAARSLRLLRGGDDASDPTFYSASLDYGDDYGVIVHHPWGDRSPEAMAQAMIELLATSPQTWNAKWYDSRGYAPGFDPGPPAIAGPRWRQFIPPRVRRRTARLAKEQDN